MRDPASEHRVFQLEGEFIARPHAALRGKRAPNIIVPGGSSPLLS
jgi:hypothetical protein